MDGYELSRCLAEGRFGSVFAAVQSSSGDRVAIKKIRARRPMAELGWDPWSKSGEREINVLSKLSHTNVLRLLDYFVSSNSGTTLLVYEYVAWDLAQVVEAKAPLRESLIKLFMSMLLTGLAYLHSVPVMHRDLKPANLLIDVPSCTLKIADFGSATFATNSSAKVPASTTECDSDANICTEPLTLEVCTRWYKAPEMLFGSVSYSITVDLWAVGCLFAEWLSLEVRHPFPGGTDIEQLGFIFQTLGTPSLDDWPEAAMLPDFCKVEFVPCAPRSFTFEADRSQESLRLLNQFLKLNPARRVSASDSLSADFFCSHPLPEDPQQALEGLSADGPTSNCDYRLPGRASRKGCRGALPLSELSSGCGSDNSFFASGAEFERLDLDAGEFERLDFETGEFERFDLETGEFEQGGFEPEQIDTTACALWDEEDMARFAVNEDGASQKTSPVQKGDAGHH